MLTKEIAALAQKYIDGTASSEEIQQLNDWYDSQESDNNSFNTGTEETRQRMLDKLMHSVGNDIEDTKRTRPAKFITTIKWVAAASVAAIFVLWWISLLDNKQTSKPIAQAQKNSAPAINNVAPGGTKATLTIDGKEVVILEDVQNGTIENSNGIKVTKNNGQLIFKAASDNKSSVVWNTLSTPRGGEYQVLLPDGSTVWLNAASSLRFPSSFTGSERSVELTGEAYFEVAKNRSKPFIVSINNMKVEVLGTHFNIMSYADESLVNTTLLEGSVKVTGANTTSMLKPGQQASLDKSDGKMTVANVDADLAIAWKNGLFQFEGTTLQSVMNQISRWYNVDVEYKGTFTTKFWGMISRKVDLAQVIKMLELTSKLHFKIEGKMITVTP